MNGIFITNLFRNPEFFWLVTLAVVPSICLHEYAHAQIALWMGDDTAARRGHLTLNPLRQMGLISMITFLIIGIAWGSVPVNPHKLTRRGDLLTSFAGPAMNLLLFLLAWLACFFLLSMDDSGLVMAVRMPKLLAFYIFYLGVYNAILFIFNMLPLPGFDGWHLFSGFIPAGWQRSEYLKGAMLFVVFGVLVCFGFISSFAGFLMSLGPVLHRTVFGG